MTENNYYQFSLHETFLITCQCRYQCKTKECNSDNQKIIWRVIHNMQHYNWDAQDFEWELKEKGKEYL